ncbi:MAG: hypothetical protein G3M78_11120 [Candidatus Nitrohelix vancouverensis]|uniref:Uncharacterized protein n=1 Tax=Candidatus Nitrohelix vancouverensis TaxID=2705534 RepID=A0A7T0C3L2_9BACT|nr:MAG: hypothetical protein G3M78_11120 [Candidatus Nitrohelix vancouverensis]
MTLFVYECEQCKHLIKHSLGGAVGNIYIFPCPKCIDNNRFRFIREGSPEFDWYKEPVKIKNKKRRDGDNLHSNAPDRE